MSRGPTGRSLPMSPSSKSRRAVAASSSTALAPDPCVVIHLSSVEVRQPCLEIRDLRAGKRVVTVIEVPSPSNKREGPGRDLYVKKQSEVLASDANLVEIDLLRGGDPTVALPGPDTPPSSYRVVVCRARDRFLKREVYPIALRDRLPRVAIPLLERDPDVVLDLPAVFAEAYEKGAYARRVDYREAPVPALQGDDPTWARERATTRSP